MRVRGLSISPLTWNVIGLDSNDVNVGPNHFPAGARVCSTGDAPATNVAYSIHITNTGGADALSVVLTDTPGAHTTLVAGSVTTTQGTVTVGKPAGGDQRHGRHRYSCGHDRSGHGELHRQARQPLPAGRHDGFHNQALVTGSNFPDVVSDNPATTPSDDPTVDVVSIAGVPEIPTVSEWGAMLLALLLAAAAAWRLRTGIESRRSAGRSRGGTASAVPPWPFPSALADQASDCFASCRVGDAAAGVVRAGRSHPPCRRVD